MTGTVIAQAIPVLISPIITRLYSPEEFGLYALYMSVAGLISIVATARYEVAIMLPDNEEDALHIAVISIFLSILISLISLVLILLFNNAITNFFKNQSLSKWLYFVPLSVLLAGFFQSVSMWMNRNKEFKSLAKRDVLKNGSTAFAQIISGLLRVGTLGLISGQLTGQFVSILFFRKKVTDAMSGPEFSCSRKKILFNLKKYRNLPFFSMPTVFLNYMSRSILIYGFNIIFNSTVVGIYSLSHRIISTPLSLISGSFTKVFFQKLVVTNNKKRLYTLAFFLNLFLGLLILSPVFLFGEKLFSFVFGNEWSEAGRMAVIISPFIAVRFASSSISNVFDVTRTNHLILVWQFIYLFLAITILYVFKDESVFVLLKYYNAFGILMYSFLFIIGLFSFRIDKNIDRLVDYNE